MNKLTLDIEVYKNYFLVSFYSPDKNKSAHYEMFDGKPLDKNGILKLLNNFTIITFNGNNFDLPLLSYALSGASCEEIKKLCDKIIVKGLAGWVVCRDHDITLVQCDHIDIFEVAPGRSSLKIYGGRLNCKTMQDLPIEPDALITPEQRKDLRDYCENDLKTTWQLYQALEKQIDLRIKMSEQYGVDLRSKSDAQIAETVIKSELQKMTGKTYRKPELPDGVTFRYQNPKIIDFKTEQLQAVFNTVLNVRFGLSSNGSVKLPDELAKTNIKIGTSTYNMGIGGLHSCEKSQYIKAENGFMLMDLDVASYYPNIILQQNLAPKSMGLPFLRVYQSIVERRIKAKRAGDKVTADTLKICVNGSFGKLGSKYSALYAPDLMIQTTITGQLALLMLIERMESEGIKVVSANTDGIVLHFHKTRLDDVRNIAFDWMLDTSYELEETHYSALASRDVNSYVAVKTDGTAKGKGIFASGGLMKNPDCKIIYKAVARFLADGTSLSDTITKCDDITQFLTVRKVTGGAVWRDVYLGKAIRFYYCKSDDLSQCAIHYAKNNNKVPKSDGAKPLMTLPDSLPGDIDYWRYINDAKELLKLVGYTHA